jgi:hypothetical protein
MSEVTLTVYDAGRPWILRVVPQGGRYGLDDCLTWDDPSPLVEFYDARGIDRFGPRGQFASRYRLAELAGHEGGLLLHGGVPEWSVSAETVSIAVGLARNVAEGLEVADV